MKVKYSGLGHSSHNTDINNLQMFIYKFASLATPGHHNRGPFAILGSAGDFILNIVWWLYSKKSSAVPGIVL